MQRIPLFIAMSIFGMVLCIFGGFAPFPINIVVCMFGGMINMMVILQIIGIAKQKNFLLLFKDLENDEKYAWIPDFNNKLHLTIMKSNHKGILYKKGLGIFEDKGTTFLFGKNKMGFIFPESAYSADIPSVQYFSILKREEGLESWEDVVKTYLGPTGYTEFRRLFRNPNSELDIQKINDELQWLIDRNVPLDKLERKVQGETIDFRSRCRWLKYNYDPVSADNATEAEKIAVWRQLTNYRDPSADYGKYGAIAKAVAMILFVIIMVVAVLSSLDLSNFMGMFGG